jgi:hypothetical protein
MKVLYVAFLCLLIAGCSSNDKQEQSNNLNLSQKLSLLDRKKVLPADDDYVLQVANQLELLSNKYKEPQDSIAEWTSKGHGLLHDDGVEDYTLNMMKEINKIPKLDNTKYKDVVAMYTMMREKGSHE